ncbi:hypothetical protein C5C18_00635 [Rathayibacter tritici]|nr:hypothetical protein C5C06_03850 [Rathayibacter tritici]PPF67887.1 hypothetical protein C5C21_05935 [Rathayibacter tritici]PPG09521.1 hypothetical protein C5C18_00635 [Rathayibacter tritici]PPI13667.1 hypothetical protein C5D07_09680 [Rathayibacter tritici]PPI43190.1 hypothetical protein C5D18_09890 [Rathayibacter tritici]
MRMRARAPTSVPPPAWTRPRRRGASSPSTESRWCACSDPRTVSSGRSKDDSPMSGCTCAATR